MYMDPATAVLERVGYSPENTYTALSESRGVPAASTCSIAIIDMCRFNNELLCDNTSALVGNLLIISRNGYLYLLPVKFARYLAYVITLQRTSIFQIPATRWDRVC